MHPAPENRWHVNSLKETKYVLRTVIELVEKYNEIWDIVSKIIEEAYPTGF